MPPLLHHHYCGATTSTASSLARRRRQRLIADWRGRVRGLPQRASTATATATATPPPPAPPPPRPAAPPPPLLEVLGPPDDWDFRADVAPGTRAAVAERYPDLLDLVDRGVLVAWRRGEAAAGASAAAAAALRGEVAPPADAAPEPELVLVLGVAHASRRSAADVDRVVRSVRPDNVVVELCRSRASLLATTTPAAAAAAAAAAGGGVATGTREDEAAETTGGGVVFGGRPGGGNGNSNASASANPVPLGGASSFAGAMARSLRLGGQAGLVLQLALGWRARRAMAAPGGFGGSLADADGVVGAEFGAAAAAADAVGAQLVLGDRPIEVTLARAWAACGGWPSRAALLRDLLLLPMPASGGGGESAVDAAERLRGDDDAVSAALRGLTRARPALASPLVHERDAYLAWSLRRSKAVRGSSVVVGIVGAAHMRGVAFCLRHGARFRRGRRGRGEGEGEGEGDEGEEGEGGGDGAAPLSFADLARPGGPRKTGAERAMRAVVDVAIGVAAWLAWDALF